MRTLLIVTMIVLSGCGVQSNQAPASASSASATPAPPTETAMNDLSELTVPSDVTPELRGARIADPANYPASLYSHSTAGYCTSTLVGPQVLLTAAHCAPNGGVVTFRKNNVDYRAVCEHAEEYPADPTADYALCAIGAPVANVRFERINIDPTRLRVGAELRLTGFGCIKNDGSGGNDGIYREGEVPIATLPSGSDNDIVTNGEVGLCFGDSGGPAFLMGPGGQRTQVSVNSRVENTDPQGTNLGTHSFLSSLSTQEALAFIRSWRSRNNFLICGYDAAATGCR